jgi:catechol 2,3-dioxygenase-like lactoylglutathione lyase family enzyme
VSPGALIEFPADDLERARRFWEGLLELRLEDRAAGEGTGVQAR